MIQLNGGRGVIAATVAILFSAQALAQDIGAAAVDPRIVQAGPVTDVASARSFLMANEGVLGTTMTSLSDGGTATSTQAGALHRALRFFQRIDGIEVEDSVVIVLSDARGHATLADVRIGRVEDGPRGIVVSQEAAVATARAALAGGDRLDVRDLAPSLVYRRHAFGDPRSAARAYWRIDVSAGGDAGDRRPMTRRMYVDAVDVTAAIAAQFPLVMAADTRTRFVTNHLPPDDPGATTATEGESGIPVGFFCAYGTSVFTTSGTGGAFALPPGFTCTGPSGPGVINVIGRWGTPTFPDVDVYQGLSPLPSLGAACGGGPGSASQPGVGGIMPPGVMTPPDLVLGGAAGQVIHWQRALRAFTAPYPSVLSGVRFTAEVDTPAFPFIACASPAGSLWRVRFGAAGVPPGGAAPVANAASSTFVVHEMGHVAWWHTTAPGLWTGADADAINEGVADVFATYVTGQESIGPGWMGPGTGALRTGLNLRQYGTLDPEGDAHDAGELLMGAFWQMRVNLMAAMGAAAGADHARALFLDWLLLFEDTTLDSRILDHLLYLDDTDGDFTNGTPHLGAITAAFHAHGFPGADPALYPGGASPVFGATFFDPASAPPAGAARMSKLALSVFDPAGPGGKPVIVIAGAPAAIPLPPFGTLAVDISGTWFTMIDGTMPGGGVFADFPASTGVLGEWNTREVTTAFWALPPGIPFVTQAFVLNPANVGLSRLSNPVALMTP